MEILIIVFLTGWAGPTVILREKALIKLRRFIMQGNGDLQIALDGFSDAEDTE